jgi:hypothetical protein
MTLIIIDTQHYNALPCAEYRYPECRIVFTIMLKVVMLSVKAPTGRATMVSVQATIVFIFYLFQVLWLQPSMAGLLLRVSLLGALVVPGSPTLASMDE